MGEHEECAQLACRGLLDVYAGLGIQQPDMTGRQCRADQSVVLGQQLSASVGIRVGKLQVHSAGALRGRNAHFHGGHLFQLFDQVRLLVTEIGSGNLNGLMNLDEPPVCIRIVTARRLPDHSQTIGKADQSDDRGFIGRPGAAVNELLGLVCLDG